MAFYCSIGRHHCPYCIFRRMICFQRTYLFGVRLLLDVLAVCVCVLVFRGLGPCRWCWRVFCGGVSDVRLVSPARLSRPRTETGINRITRVHFFRCRCACMCVRARSPWAMSSADSDRGSRPHIFMGIRHFAQGHRAMHVLFRCSCSVCSGLNTPCPLCSVFLLIIHLSKFVCSL